MKRILTAVALIPVALYLVFWSPAWAFFLAAAVMGIICYLEYSAIVAKHGIRRSCVLGVATGLLLLIRPHFGLLELGGMSLLAFITALRFPNLRDILPHVAAMLLGAIYTFVPWRFAIDLRRESIHLIFFALALNWAGDSAAFYIGRTFGRHKLLPSVSPNKSWEGTIASILGSAAFGFIYLGLLLKSLGWWQIALLAVIGNIAGQLGDLVESAMKRGAGLKDSGRILPGHGGMLDRVDSSLFAIPVVYALHFLISAASV
jgi:phosphatidate cytidylyltransferase